MDKKKKKLVLSSSSKNRKLILEKIGIPFEVFSPNISENSIQKESPIQMTRRLSFEKGTLAKKKFKTKFIISADTVVYSRKKIINKTNDRTQAKLNLKALSGRRHRVYTGITFFTDSGSYFQYVCKSIVKFRLLDNKDIDNYLSTDEWKGCAGSYAIQGFAESFVEMLSGSYSNVVGLPIHKTYIVLKNYKLI